MKPLIPIIIGALLGVLSLLLGAWRAKRRLREAREQAGQLLHEARVDAENQQREILVAAHEKSLAQREETDQRERELDQREARLDQRQAKLDRGSSELGQQRKQLQDLEDETARLRDEARQAREDAVAARDEARRTLEHIAGLTAEQAREAVIAEVEQEARSDAERMARHIEDEARQRAEREAVSLMLQASQRVDLRDVAESTVTFIELPSDEMKGRIIGKEGRNIRALEMATGIDLVVDDTPRTILISSFDPVRREVARVSIDRLIEDGRIHPARIEEVVDKARQEIDQRVDEKGTEAALHLGISDLHPRLIRLVGGLRYRTAHGQNLLQHCLETAMIGGFMADQIGARGDLVRRAGLLHEVGQAEEGVRGGHPVLLSADLAGKYGESRTVVHAIRALHQDARPRDVEALLLSLANRLSENRPGARKENLAVFIERLRRLEAIATSFAGVRAAYAVKSGKEIRVIVDTDQTRDDNAYALSKHIARTLERELNYPGQIKVHVVRETRAVRYAM